MPARQFPILRVILLAAAMLLVGCATHSDLVSRKEPLLDANNGFVVISLGHDSTFALPRYVIPVTPVNGNTQPPFAIRTRANLLEYGAWNIDEAVRAASTGGKRVLLGYSVKAGEYEFDEVNVALYNGIATYSSKFTLQRPYRFHVSAGEVTYLGALEASITTAGNVMGELIPFLSLQVPSTVRIRFLNEETEDRAVLVRMRPELRNAPLRLANEAIQRPASIGASGGGAARPSPVAVSPTAASNVVATRATGKDTYSAEQLTRTLSCPAPRATLVDKGPGFEVHRVLCAGGESRTVRCQFGSCTIVPGDASLMVE